MRTSEAERQRVADFLRDACADGRLGPDELEHRLDRLFAGGTVADVEALVWDLPGGDGVVPRLHPAAGVRAPARHAGGSPAGAGAVALIGLGVVAIALAALPHAVFVLAMVVLVAALAASTVVAVALAPAGLLLLGLVWLFRLLRGRPRPLGPRDWPRRDGRPLA